MTAGDDRPEEVEVVVNGERRRLPVGTTVGALVDELAPSSGRRGVAAAVNGEVVGRGGMDDAELTAGDRVEIVGAVQGGCR